MDYVSRRVCFLASQVRQMGRWRRKVLPQIPLGKHRGGGGIWAELSKVEATLLTVPSAAVTVENPVENLS